MFEKVNPSHPDKVADRIAGAIVDLAYSLKENPKIAVEVLLGHGSCSVIVETDTPVFEGDIDGIVGRIAGVMQTRSIIVKQDQHLADNQKGKIRCGDNGIFKGVPVTEEQKRLSEIARFIYGIHPTDGKYIIDKDRLIVCQSNAETPVLFCEINDQYKDEYKEIVSVEINPLGDWTGGTYVDAGCTNRKLGSDMADSVTGGGLHGKDLSKADVSVNIYCWLKAQETGHPVEMCCAIGDETIDGKPYSEIVEVARQYIKSVGGFEKFAEWGLV